VSTSASAPRHSACALAAPPATAATETTAAAPAVSASPPGRPNMTNACRQAGRRDEGFRDSGDGRRSG
jgi:hypothetical protein